MVILRTNISNILPSIKETIRINAIKPLKPLYYRHDYASIPVTKTRPARATGTS